MGQIDESSSDAIEIISSATCPYAQRTRMALIEKGLDFTLTQIDLDAKPDWFLAISPYGKVPVLRHRGAVLFESAVINEYLEDVFGEPPLLPRDPVARAKARIWIDFANVRYIPHVYKLMLAQTQETQEVHRRRLTEALQLMEEQLSLSGGPYFLGSALSLVDLSFFPHTHRFVALARYRDFPIPDWAPRVKAWAKLMHTRPSAVATSAPDETLIRNWAKYAHNTSTGTTARDMRES